jgi:hypothetical protein
VQLEALAVALRPRTMGEATDLGVRLVQANARSIWRSFVPVYIVVTALAIASAGIANWLPELVIFWLKPWLDRSLLFILARAVFGQSSHFADLWRERRSVWFRRPFSTLVTQRLSAWRSYTLPLDQLEAQRGAALRARRKSMLLNQRNHAGFMQFAFANMELAIVAGGWSLAVWFSLPGQAGTTLEQMFRGQPGFPLHALQLLSYSLAVLVVEPFYVAAGFAMYLNRRVQLEAWDIEQEFRRAFA